MKGPVAHAVELLGSRARVDEPLGRRTTYRVGGSAALLVLIEDEAALNATRAAVAASGVDVLVLGNGSNLLVADSGYPGLVVSLGGAFADIRVDANSATVSGGGAASYPALARQSAAAGLAGMEWAVGIPGSIGGAVAMNAGGHGASTGDRLVSARLVDLAGGAERDLAAADLALAYRHSNVAASDVVLEATFACEPGEPGASAEQIASIVRWRRENQPGGRNAGSVFTNPPGDSAGRLIELSGLKGRRVGTAEVSAKHANFIQVDADGSADDVVRLVELVRGVVAAETGVALETELRIVGARSVGAVP
ncbi:MAG: UDP-N-acetylenolpyruvoylglucosamine reductase [Acidimicrobiaceae bacterium]|nr:UDP-N-acetylenolpyruvoylglucosamine reductase [Acidimicrobiaceae bacterium]